MLHVTSDTPNPDSRGRTTGRRRNSHSSSSSTSPERGVDDDENEYFMVSANDSQSSLSLTPSDPEAMQYSREDDYALAQRCLESPVQRLPSEILINIFSRLNTPIELLTCMLVSRHWARNSVALLWHKPLMNKWSNVERVVKASHDAHKMFDYPAFIRRLNFTSLGPQISDGTLASMSICKRLERLTLSGCRALSDMSLAPLIQCNRNLVALDVTRLEGLTNRTLIALAENCPRLQGLNVTNCVNLTDVSISLIAKSCRFLKRLKVTNCKALTSVAVSDLAHNCPNLLEIDLGGLDLLESRAVSDLMSCCRNLRELRLQNCVSIDDQAFMLAPITCDALRILDLSCCGAITDKAIETIVSSCARIRNLLLVKCRLLTDRSVYAISKLAKNLHHIHLGHCIQLTDDSIAYLSKHCTRIRYIDLTCCTRLTDTSIAQLAVNLPKLTRVGLVKCAGITDRGILALATLGGRQSRSRSGLLFGGNVLERVHLSYCTALTPLGVHALLNNCAKLTHLSLTGVQPFLTEEIQTFCRSAPAEFNEHQRVMFCVFSGSGVARLRAYLNTPQSQRFHAITGRSRAAPPPITDMAPMPPGSFDMLDEEDLDEEADSFLDVADGTPQQQPHMQSVVNTTEQTYDRDFAYGPEYDNRHATGLLSHPVRDTAEDTSLSPSMSQMAVRQRSPNTPMESPNVGES